MVCGLGVIIELPADAAASGVGGRSPVRSRFRFKISNGLSTVLSAPVSTRKSTWSITPSLGSYTTTRRNGAGYPAGRAR